MINKISIGLSKLFFVCVITYTGLVSAADISNSNIIPVIDSDGDGHIDRFEIEVITNGQVHPDWDYGLTGFIGSIDLADWDAAAVYDEIYYRQSIPYRSKYHTGIGYCETDQSHKFAEFIAASKSLMEDEGVDYNEKASSICQLQKITTISSDPDHENVEKKADQEDFGYIRATFHHVPSAVVNNDFFPNFGRHNRNSLNISRSSPLVVPNVEEVYLEVEIRDNDSYGWVDGWLHLSNLGWKHQKSIDVSQWGDVGCLRDPWKGAGYLFLDTCEFNVVRIPLKSKSTKGISHPGNSPYIMENIDTITLDMVRDFQQDCGWTNNAEWHCRDFFVSVDIKSVKIVGGDFFPNDPNEYLDFDNDGLGNNSDPDNDNDGTPNDLDAFPFNPIVKADLDGDGVANIFDIDTDGDGIPRYTSRINGSDPENGWFGFDLNDYPVFSDAAKEVGCDVNDLSCYERHLSDLYSMSSGNPLIAVGNSGGQIVWRGGNEFDPDYDDDNDGYINNLNIFLGPSDFLDSDIDAFPNDPAAWADIDKDCVPDNIDNDLSSIPDTDCDGVDNSIDLDDDNDSVPDNLIVPVIEDGLLNTQWQADSNIIDENGASLCAIEDTGLNPNASCNQLSVSYQFDNDNTESRVIKLDFQNDSSPSSTSTRRGIEFRTYEYLNVHSWSLGDYVMPAGFLEVELKLVGATGDEYLGFNLISSYQKLSQTLPTNLRTYWPKVYSGEWTSLKIPLYEFFNDIAFLRQNRYFWNLPELRWISGLRVSSTFGDSPYSVIIRDIKFVLEDKNPYEAPTGIYQSEYFNNDFDNDGSTGVFDEHPFVANLDTDGDGTTDGVDDDIDGDYIPKIEELENGTDPYAIDTDRDGVDDSNDIEPLNFYVGALPQDISGVWRLAQKAGAIGVGRAEGSIGDWSSTDYSLAERDCQFDDTYSFQATNPIYPATGAFTQDMGDSTWYEVWQPAANPLGYQHCDTPYAPFDGSTPDMTYKWDLDEGTLTLYGLGAHIGLPRVANEIENKGEDITSVTYKIETASENFIALNILSDGPSPWWHFELERVRNADGSPVSDDSSSYPDSASSTGYLDYATAKWLPNHLGEVQIPSQFEQIGYRAFSGLDITSVDIPNSVTEIHSMAFQNNSRLTEVNFGDAISEIGAYAFEKTAIKHVSLPDTVTQIGPYAFANSDIEQIYLGDSVEYIGEFAFAGASISNLIIPSTVKTIGDNAFDYLDGNVYVISPADQWISIFNFPLTANFFTCLGLDANGNPEQCSANYELIGNTVFDRSTALEILENGHISIPNTYHRISERALEGLQGVVNSVTIPNSVTHIDDYAFKDLGLTSIILPNSIVSIGNGAFSGNKLSNISLPNNLMHIGYAAFAENNLGSIVLPASLAKVGPGAFINSNLSEVSFPEGLKSIEQNAFAYNAITDIVLPRSLNFIGDGAFDNNQIKSAVFNADGSIGKDAFANNPLITATLADDVKSPGGVYEQNLLIKLNNYGEIQVIQSVDNGVFYDSYDLDENGEPLLPSDGLVIGYKETHTQGDAYTDRGATAHSYYFGSIDVQISGEVDPNITGTQVITYTASDLFGNNMSLNRYIEVIDNKPPVITLNGNPTELIHVNSAYIDPSATAFDAVDDAVAEQQPTVLIEKKSKQDGSFRAVADIDTSETGEYRYTYTFTDTAGNSASTSRKVLVIPGEGEQVVILENGNAGIEFDSPIQAFDQELQWNNCSSAVCPSIDFGWVDDEERDHQVLQISHAQTSAGAGVFISSSDPIDLRGSRDEGIYQLDLKVISGDRRVSFKADCTYPCGGGDQIVTIAEYGVWETIAVPVEDLIPNGPAGNILDLEIVTGGLIIQATGAYGTVFRIDNVIWKCGTTCEGVDIPYVPVDWESNHEDKAVGYDAPTSYDGYTQVWADEFSGNAVDYQKWGFDLGNGDAGWGNGELQHYRAENASVDNGMLIIEAKKHQPALPGGIRYTSAKLKTDGKFQFKYGRVDIRAVVAEGQGLWSTAWMLGANHSQIGWPYSGEIDIVDTIGGVRGGIPQEGMIVQNMYWNATGPNPSEPYSPAKININGSAEYRINDSNEGETFSNRFHVFSMIWDEDKIQFQVDGVDTVRIDLNGSLAETYRNSFYLILNVAVGGAWPRSPGDNINFPDGMLVDYVRVFQVDTDGDGVADYDLDGDTPLDAFPNNPYESVGDGIGDTPVDTTQFDNQANEKKALSKSIYNNSTDADGDGVTDDIDAFKYNYLEWLDTDNDGVGNNSDNDDDNDAVADALDAFPLDVNEWLDTDTDGIGNNADRDDDGDLIPDIYDLFPLSNRDWQDMDHDGIGDNSDIDSDGDGYMNTLDAFPLDALEWIDTDGAGVGDNADTDDDGDGVPDNHDTEPLNPDISIYVESQIINVQGNPVGFVGKTTSIDIGYDTSNNSSQTLGTGFRVHYDSNILTIKNISYVLQKDLIVDGDGPIYDVENYDGIPTTDVYYSFGWASLMGDWPDEELPATILSIEAQINPYIDVIEGASTPINFSSTSIAAGYKFTANNYDLELMNSNWDFDANGHVDALTDGLIMLRYAFGVRGDALIENALSPESTMTASDIGLVMEKAATIADIDANGDVNALTDGVILMRYLFGLKNESMIDRVVAPNASRTSLEAIIEYIDQYMPSGEPL